MRDLLAAIDAQDRELELDPIQGPAGVSGGQPAAADGSFSVMDDDAMIPPQEIDVMLNLLCVRHVASR
jgi:hypothetical protein